MQEDCLFCKIISGKLPSEKIYEDEHTFAFLDIHPVNKGHTLVVPKKHLENIYEIDAESFSAVMKTVHYLTPYIKTALNADGVNIGMNNGTAAGQLVFHAHVHIIPRFLGDGHKHWHGDPYEKGEITKLRDTIIEKF